MQIAFERSVLVNLRNPLLILFGITILAGSGCQRLGDAVSEYLPAKTKQVAATNEAPKEQAADDGFAGENASPEANMGGESAGGADVDPFDDPTGEPEQNFGPEGGETFDPADDLSLDSEAGVGPGPETDPLTGSGSDDLQDPGTFVDEFTGGSVDDPAGEPVGDPGLTPTGDGFPETNQGPVGRPSVGAGGGGSGKRAARSKRDRNAGNGKPSSSNPNNMRIEQPQGRPPMRLTANAAVPAMTREGQRIGFSVEYQLQFEGLSPNGEYGLVIESAKNGRYGTAVRLGEEGTLQVPAVPQFRPTSGPFKAFLVQRTNKGMQRISNVVEFKTLF